MRWCIVLVAGSCVGEQCQAEEALALLQLRSSGGKCESSCAKMTKPWTIDGDPNTGRCKHDKCKGCAPCAERPDKVFNDEGTAVIGGRAAAAKAAAAAAAEEARKMEEAAAAEKAAAETAAEEAAAKKAAAEVAEKAAAEAAKKEAEELAEKAAAEAAETAARSLKKEDPVAAGPRAAACAGLAKVMQADGCAAGCGEETRHALLPVVALLRCDLDPSSHVALQGLAKELPSLGPDPSREAVNEKLVEELVCTDLAACGPAPAAPAGTAPEPPKGSGPRPPPEGVETAVHRPEPSPTGPSCDHALCAADPAPWHEKCEKPQCAECDLCRLEREGEEELNEGPKKWKDRGVGTIEGDRDRDDGTKVIGKNKGLRWDEVDDGKDGEEEGKKGNAKKDKGEKDKGKKEKGEKDKRDKDSGKKGKGKQETKEEETAAPPPPPPTKEEETPPPPPASTAAEAASTPGTCEREFCMSDPAPWHDKCKLPRCSECGLCRWDRKEELSGSLNLNQAEDRAGLLELPPLDEDDDVELATA